MTSNASVHTSVLLQEVIDSLSPITGSLVVDATLNDGAVIEALCRQFPSFSFVGIDADEAAILKAEKRLHAISCAHAFVHGNFRDIAEHLKRLGHTEGSLGAAIFDLGLSSDQLLHSGRGFSFQKSEPLLMTLSSNPVPGALSARDIVNSWDEENIAAVVEAYGEERFAKRIARAIVGARGKKAIETSGELAAIIREAVPQRGFTKIDPATRTFQALRITVNDELAALKEGLAGAFQMLSRGGRISVISFHSLEDRIVKHFMKEKALAGEGRLIVKKPIIPTEEEVTRNPRARSAKLRIIEKI